MDHKYILDIKKYRYSKLPNQMSFNRRGRVGTQEVHEESVSTFSMGDGWLALWIVSGTNTDGLWTFDI